MGLAGTAGTLPSGLRAVFRGADSSSEAGVDEGDCEGESAGEGDVVAEGGAGASSKPCASAEMRM